MRGPHPGRLDRAEPLARPTPRSAKGDAAMAIDTTTPRPRRALLAGLAGGLAATVANGLGRADPVSAHDPDDVRLGADNSATTRTEITNTATNGTAFAGEGSGAGTGVAGFSNSSGQGVYGFSNSGQGVYGYSNSGKALSGYSPAGYAVYAVSASATAIYASAVGPSAGYGVHAIGRAIGLYGESDTGGGIYGKSASGNGVTGGSTSGVGVFAASHSDSRPAAIGQSYGDNTGLQGQSGVIGPSTSPAKTGVYGFATQDAGAKGMWGNSPTGRGGVFTGKVAQVRLTPSSAASHPSSGAKGDLFVDTSGRLWFCKGGTTWKQLA
jgi:hypothetical protein